MASVFQNTIKFIERNTKTGWRKTENGGREAIRSYPKDAVREALVNAMSHRDYSIAGTQIDVDIYCDRIEIVSLGSCLQMATFGGNAVISADEEMHPWLENWVKEKSGFWLFEQHNFYELESEIRKHGYKMALTHHMFLPAKDTSDFKTDIKVKWLEQEDIHPFYGREEFSNALCDRFKPERPDVLAVIALDGEKIMGMAGCSADTPLMWQIGIDVLPEYRDRGIGKTLVNLLKNEAIRRGAIPYYGTSLSNIFSWKIAFGSGFAPAWIETESRPCNDNEFAK